MDFEVIIGFETHVELRTRTKLFCDCPVAYDAPPNSLTCPVCSGQPGALPVLNRRAVAYTIKAGLALNCHIHKVSRFARKNYFYPDLPKGYQISQYERPFCENGFLEITGDDGRPYAVGINRVHLEEDAGKLVHSADSFEASEYSLVDYNRSSVPLMEIVTDHTRNPIRSTTEARNYLEKLRQIIRYVDISDCSMEKGQFRCDVNVSIRPPGAEYFCNRSEIKNMASFRFILNAIDYEVQRQWEIMKSGGDMPQETRLFDEATQTTMPMRGKEDAPDYRYFPDPDLLEVDLDETFVEEIRGTMPELPDQRLHRAVREYGLSRPDALILTRDRQISDFFEACLAHYPDGARLGRWMTKDLFKALKDAGISIDAAALRPETFAALLDLVDKGEVTEEIARKLLAELVVKGGDPEQMIKARGLGALQDADALQEILDGVIRENPAVVDRIREGEDKPIDFLVGQVMRKTRGKAPAKKVKEMILASLR
ncbi:MAG: Asp-tRNA(Asn)/Glu-tRNA(Gln) amidotransferase subunit GatB [Deltaproteobacteria bacterium]|nr:Asp-tRNA(Asn)/Glu-tRNA(Gln) amidotransferase subunit GatB [Deltaproteobacteria bacterium]